MKIEKMKTNKYLDFWKESTTMLSSEANDKSLMCRLIDVSIDQKRPVYMLTISYAYAYIILADMTGQLHCHSCRRLLKYTAYGN